MRRDDATGWAIAAGLGSSILFALHYVAAKSLLAHPVPVGLAALRGLVGGALLLALAARRHGLPRRIAPAALGSVAVAALFGFFINQLCFMAGLARSSPAEAALISNTIPLASTAIAAAAGIDPATRRAWLGLGLGFAAIAVHFALELRVGASEHLVGNLLLLANVVAFSVSFVVQRRTLASLPAESLAGGMLFLGGAALLALGGSQAVTLVKLAAADAGIALVLAYEIVVSTAVAWLLNVHALSRLSVSRTSVFVYAQLPFTALATAAIGGPWPALELWLVAAAVFAAVAIVVRSRQVTPAGASAG